MSALYFCLFASFQHNARQRFMYVFHVHLCVWLFFYMIFGHSFVIVLVGLLHLPLSFCCFSLGGEKEKIQVAQPDVFNS